MFSKIKLKILPQGMFGLWRYCLFYSPTRAEESEKTENYDQLRLMPAIFFFEKVIDRFNMP
jgi:hypothetical protein